MVNIHRLRINMDVPKARGSGYVASHGHDFLLANDEWARFINLKYGPDGNVYLIDWYDKQACHHNDPGVWDRTNGRIYKVSYRGTRPVAGIDLQKCTDDELVAYQTNANDWYVRHGRRILQERVAADQEILPPVLASLEQLDVKGNPTIELRKLWALHAIGSSQIATQKAKYGPFVRSRVQNEEAKPWSVRLMLEYDSSSPEVIEVLTRLAKSASSPTLRRYIASGLQRVPVQDRKDVLAGLVSHAEDAAVFNLPLLYWYALEPLAGSDPKAALDVAAAGRVPIVLEFAARRIATTSSLKQNEILVAALSKAAETKDTGAALALLRGM